MKFKATTEQIRRATEKVARKCSIGKEGLLYIEAPENGEGVLFTMNETGVESTYWLDIETEEAGAVYLSYRALQVWAKNAANAAFWFSDKRGVLTVDSVESSRTKAHMCFPNNMDATTFKYGDFPEKELGSFRCGSAEFIDAVKRAGKVVSEIDIYDRPLLCNIWFDCSPKRIRMVGCDGFRAAIVTLEDAGYDTVNRSNGLQFLVPIKPLRDFLKTYTKREMPDFIDIEVHDGWNLLIWGELTMKIPRNTEEEVQFVPIDNFFPDENAPVTCEVNRDDLESLVKRFTKMIPELYEGIRPAVKLVVSDKEMTLGTAGVDFTMEETLDAKTKGEIRIFLDPYYLQDLVTCTYGSQSGSLVRGIVVTLQLWSARKPLVIEEESSGYQGILLPVNMKYSR